MRLNLLVPLMLVCLAACSDNEPRTEEPVQPSAAPEAASAPKERADRSSSDAKDGLAETKRKIYYDGALELETPEPAKVIADASAKVKALGGYTELETKDTVILHVPVASFMQTFEDMQGFGKVLKKNLTGSDVTDAYNDAALRKQLVAASLKKLEQLLTQAKSASERLSLLKEIGELKGRLEEAEAMLAMLSNKAEYSRLTLTTVEPARAIASMKPRPIGVFAWIDALSPEQTLARSRGKKIELPIPSDYVLVPNDAYWMAESASQATFSATKLVNEPLGDTKFWVETLKHRLKARYDVAAVEAHGKFQILRLKDRATDSYRYDVGVMTEGKSLVVTESVYPSVADEQRFGPKVFAALGTYDGKGL